MALHKNGRTIRGTDNQLWLEQPGLIFPDLGFMLRVYQKKGDHPGTLPPAAEATHIDVPVLRIRNPGPDSAYYEGDRL